MAGIGPFDSFVFPGVYTTTQNEAPRATAAGGLRVPAYIGIGDETLQVNNYEMIRGSSSMADNRIVKEDVSALLTGANRNFNVTFFPIVQGNGRGITTTDPNDVSVYVDDEKVPVSSVNGTTGEIYLISIPAMGSIVQVTYYFKKSDTLISDEDLSDQVYYSNTSFKVKNVPIVQGDNGGITTTDPTKVTVKVNNNTAVVSSVDGDTGVIVLSAAPLVGDTVTVTYYTNDLQDTMDILPTPNLNAVLRVGYSPGTADFSEGLDFVVDTTGNFSTLNWGHSYKVAAGHHTIGYTYFDASQITGHTLFDNRVFRREATGTADGTNKTFVLETPPMVGNGLGRITDNPSLLSAYVGTSPVDASSAPVVSVDGSTKVITLRTAPAADSTVYVTEYTNILQDDTWTLQPVVAGVSGVGSYTVIGTNSGSAMATILSPTDTTVASGAFSTELDQQVMPGYAVEELVSLTFTDASTYVVTSSVSGGSGSSGDNTGYVNQTYIDSKTGFRITVTHSLSADYVTGNKIGYRVSETILTDPALLRVIPGIRTIVTDTVGIHTNDTATIKTYNKSGAEPNIGDFYYVTYKEDKQSFDKAYFVTTESDALALTGALSATNKLGMAAHVAFLNGAPAVVLYQVQRAPDSDEATSSDYIAGIDYFNEPMEGGFRPVFMEPVTTMTSVINYLKTSNIIQSGIRYANERMSYFGFALGTTPTAAQAYARSMNSERMIGVYPDGAIVTIPDAYGNDVEYLMDGALFASAIAARASSPAFDVATPLDRKPVVGFTRLYRRMDTVTAAQTANSGLTVLEEQAAGIYIRIALTTDLSSVLSQTPSVVAIKDFVQRGTRSVLIPFIGEKLLSSKISEIESSLGSYLRALKQAQIIADYSGVKASLDPSDPRIIRVEAAYSPVFPLLWIVVTYNLRSSM